MIKYSDLVDYSEKYGNSYYLVDLQKFSDNYDSLLSSFKRFYEKTCIAYSFKTNYLPAICGIVKQKGGYAEIVSGMELELARKIGFRDEEIYYNGPCKDKTEIESLLSNGGHVNIDGEYEIKLVKELASKFPDNVYKVGIRCLGDIQQESPSRFGLELDNGDFERAIVELKKHNNVIIEGLHLHLPFRNLESFKERLVCAEKYILLFEKYNVKLSYFSFGGGYMGHVPSSMKNNFSFDPPSYIDYAEVMAKAYNTFTQRYNCLSNSEFIIEPGSALVADVVKYVSRVVNIKASRDRVYATLDGSTFNINPQVKGINRPFVIYSDKNHHNIYNNVFFAGYTCIEGDYLITEYNGIINVGDFVVFENIGSYSLTMKPPFIRYDSAYIESNSGRELARRQKFADIFSRFCFE